jgi:hypothetical protein
MLNDAFLFKSFSAVRYVILSLALSIGVSLTGSLAVAADGSGGTGNEVGLYIGSMLPNQIEGVTEILPVFGGRYGLGLGFGFLEIGLANSHAMGVDFTTAELSIRADIPAGGGLGAFVYGGVDMSYYSPLGSNVRRTDYGGHVGAGATMEVSSDFALRTDLKLMGGPGVSLYLLVGFQIKL